MNTFSESAPVSNHRFSSSVVGENDVLFNNFFAALGNFTTFGSVVEWYFFNSPIRKVFSYRAFQ